VDTDHDSRYPPEMGESVKDQNNENHVFLHFPSIFGIASTMNVTNTTCGKGKGNLISIVTIDELEDTMEHTLFNCQFWADGMLEMVQYISWRMSLVLFECRSKSSSHMIHRGGDG